MVPIFITESVVAIDQKSFTLLNFQFQGLLCQLKISMLSLMDYIHAQFRFLIIQILCMPLSKSQDT